MNTCLDKFKRGYENFRRVYATDDKSIMHQLSSKGQNPEVMIVACADSRVDPAVVLGAEPGDFFIVRSVANIVPPFESDHKQHGISAALEFAVCYLGIKHIVILGHSQCGGISALLNQSELEQNDFITDWVSVIDDGDHECSIDEYAMKATGISAKNCLSFSWMADRVEKGRLRIHRWFFNIDKGELSVYDEAQQQFVPFVDHA